MPMMQSEPFGARVPFEMSEPKIERGNEQNERAVFSESAAAVERAVFVESTESDERAGKTENTVTAERAGSCESTDNDERAATMRVPHIGASRNA